jgi:hypothetical protein
MLLLIVGLDYSLFKGIVTGTFEVYNRSNQEPVGTTFVTKRFRLCSGITNLGQVNNSGFEMSVTTQNMKRSNFEWRTTLNFWFNRNKIVHLYGATPDYDATGKLIGESEKDDLINGWYIGHSISEKFDYKIIGVWQVAEAALAKNMVTNQVISGHRIQTETVRTHKLIKYSWATSLQDSSSV